MGNSCFQTQEKVHDPALHK